MTRYPSTHGVARTRLAALPTSRYAAGQELGIMAGLRNLAPRHALHMNEAVELAERQAEQLLRLARLDRPPVPSALITELPRVLVCVDVDLPASGGTQWVNGRWLLLINGSEPPTRQRFSLAHEYKHALDHRYREMLYQGIGRLSADEQAERAADAFAAALLMPRSWLLDAWQRGFQRRSTLADLFEVSPQAMARRLQTLGLRSALANRSNLDRRAA